MQNESFYLQASVPGKHSDRPWFWYKIEGISCRISIAYSIANHLSVNFKVLIIWIWEESSGASCSKHC